MCWKRYLPLIEQPWGPSPHAGQWCLHHRPPWRQGFQHPASCFPRNKTCSSDYGTAVRSALLLKLHQSELSGAGKGSKKSKPWSLNSSRSLGPSSERGEAGIFDVVPWTKCLTVVGLQTATNLRALNSSSSQIRIWSFRQLNAVIGSGSGEEEDRYHYHPSAEGSHLIDFTYWLAPSAK